MGFREQNAPLSQAVHVRRFHLRMAVKATDPVIEVIDNDEHHVGPLGSVTGEG